MNPASNQERIFWKIWLPIFTKKHGFFSENRQKIVINLDKKWPKPHEGAELATTEDRLGLSTPRHPYSNIPFGHINGFEFNFYFFVWSSSFLSLLQERTTAGFTAHASSDLHLCFKHNSNLEMIFWKPEVFILHLIYFLSRTNQYFNWYMLTQIRYQDQGLNWQK